MKSLSATQLDPTNVPPGPGKEAIMAPETMQGSVNTLGTTPTSWKSPDFGNLANVYAATARTAGRINAASVTPEEYQGLLAERQRLLDKKLSGKSSRRDEIRLEYVRWSLDRIEDAKHGAALEALENSVAKYEQFLSDVQE